MSANPEMESVFKIEGRIVDVHRMVSVIFDNLSAPTGSSKNSSLSRYSNWERVLTKELQLLQKILKEQEKLEEDGHPQSCSLRLQILYLTERCSESLEIIQEWRRSNETTVKVDPEPEPPTKKRKTTEDDVQAAAAEPLSPISKPSCFEPAFSSTRIENNGVDFTGKGDADDEPVKKAKLKLHIEKRSFDRTLESTYIVLQSSQRQRIKTELLKIAEERDGRAGKAVEFSKTEIYRQFFGVYEPKDDDEKGPFMAALSTLIYKILTNKIFETFNW